MVMIGRALQVGSAGMGFFVGYLWVVSRWLGGEGPLAGELMGAAATAGCAVSAVYAGLLAILCWGRIPVPDTRSVRMVVSPAMFTGSCLVGASGIRAALWVLG